MTTTAVTLDAADATELADLLEFLNDWIHDDHAAASYHRFTLGLLTADELKADLSRFSYLLGSDTIRYPDR